MGRKGRRAQQPSSVFQGQAEVGNGVVQSGTPGEQQGFLEPRAWGGVRMGWEEQPEEAEIGKG